MSNEKVRVKIICETCETTHGCEVDYNTHVAGRKHKRKLAKQNSEILSKAKKQLHEKKGVYVGNLPQNTRSDELLSYIGSFGKIDKSVINSRFAKILFENEESAIIFKNTKHIYKNYTLKIGTWVIDIPPSLEDDKEEKNKQLHEAVTKSLATNCSIDQQVDALLSTVLMPPSQVSSCYELCKDLGTVLRCVYGSRFSMHMFGSVVTTLAFRMSDLDVVVDTNFTLQRYMNGDVSQESFNIDKPMLSKVSNALWKRFCSVVPIFSAKIPIIRCVHRATGISCDVSFSNVTGVQNSYLIQHYVQSDPRVKVLLVILKYWAKYFGLKKSCFSNYALVMMGLYYLMQLDDSPLPPVINFQRSAQRRLLVDGWNCSFDVQCNLKGLSNTVTVLDLLQGFFEFYAQYDYGMYVICPLIGKAVPKIFFKNVEQLPRELTSTQSNQAEALEHVASLKVECNICIQDPFILDRNITGFVRGEFANKIQRMFVCSGRVLKEDCVTKGTTGFLKHLFQRRTEDLLLIPSYWRQPISDNMEIDILVDCYIPSLECDANTTVEDAQNAWYNRVYTVLKNEILEKCFLFEVEDVTSSNRNENSTDDDMSPNKKRKEDVTKGINMETYSNLRRITCKRKGPDIYANRKLITKELALNQNMSFIEINEAVSRHMMKLDGPVETVMFMCCFHLITRPTHIILEMSNLGSENAFKSWIQYVSAHLPSWLAQLLPTTLKATSSEVSVTSPQ